MRLLVLNHMQNAYESLRANRMRTLLTMLGISIGVASITSILALSSGATRLVSEQVDSLGGNIAVIRPGKTTESSLTDFTSPTGQKTVAASTLTERDIESIALVDNVEAVAPIMLINGSLAAGDQEVLDASILATTPDFMEITQLETRDGQFIDSVTNEDTAVIGPQLSVELFGTEQSIGRSFSLRGQTFTVIGVLKRQNNPVNYNSVDFDKTAIINLKSGKAFYENIARIQQINIRADNIANLDKVITNVTAALINNHQGEQDFSILSGEEISRPTSQIFDAVAATAAAIAGISLVVGGIGIMNIMLVSVAERTREIGIRKALGASNMHITWQFLIESLALGIGGGFIGYIFGYLLAFGLSTLLPFTPVFTWQIAAIALAVSMSVGVAFGIYPAVRAAQKDPIESLRHYS